ncbi:MAG: hypothetical protein ACREDR_32870 [Blastocatellia bacterium]
MNSTSGTSPAHQPAKGQTPGADSPRPNTDKPRKSAASKNFVINFSGEDLQLIQATALLSNQEVVDYIKAAALERAASDRGRFQAQRSPAASTRK